MAMKTQQERQAAEAAELRELVERARTAGDKTYTYREGKFRWDVTGQGLICVALIVWAIWAIVVGYLRPLAYIVIVVAAYGAWKTFISLSYVHSVKLTSDTISFECYGKTRSYQLKDVHNLRLREFPATYKLYVRMDDDNLLHGRYWVRGAWMSDGDELYFRLVDLEVKLNPDSLKARARQNNNKYLAEHEAELAAKAERYANKSKSQKKKEARKFRKDK